VLQGLGELEPYPDAAEAIGRLHEAGLPLGTLTNGGEEHTRRLLERGGLANAVELVITVDEVRAYKPHAAPYQRAAERLVKGFKTRFRPRRGCIRGSVRRGGHGV
jgi:2-haloacid dehalogenase